MTVLGTYLGGFFGSISQLSLFSEIGTMLVNISKILNLLDLQNSKTYNLFGTILICVFYLSNVFLYSYFIFWKMQDMCMYRYAHFWVLYPKNLHVVCYVYITLYFLKYCHHLYTHSKLIISAFKVLGIEEAVDAIERI